jgi:peptidoglycan/xylan/chitin deacetylase (PgdA/CDA1 family)
MKKAVLIGMLSTIGLRALLARALPWSGVLVLTYHRVGQDPDSPFDQGLWSAGAEDFARQVRLCKSHLDMISPDDLPQALASGRGRHGIITFDDGYRDNYQTAWPILKAEGVGATFFVSTGFIDEPRLPWWDEIAWMVRGSRLSRIDMPGWLPAAVPMDEPGREGAVRALLRAFKATPSESTDDFLHAAGLATGSGRCRQDAARNHWMDWDMLREMRSSGMTIGGHTVSHPVLAQASPDRQRQEILGCASRLAAELGQPMRYFSYPVGGPLAFDKVTRQCLAEAGVRFAFSYYGGYNSFDGWDDFDVRRVPVETHLTTAWFRSILSIPRIFA